MSESLTAASRALHKQFAEVVEPYREELWRYCRMLTGSPWEGEDLFQETMLKAFAMLTQLWHPLVPKAYLFRIASNTWIDQCRKRRVSVEWLNEGEEPAPIEADPVEVQEAVEALIEQLPPQQAVVFLLMEVFGFTAPEVAGMIHATSGSVYATLHRARAKVKALRATDSTSAAGAARSRSAGGGAVDH